MKKVVINNCYGGFGLSLKALEYYASLKGDGDIFHYRINLGGGAYRKITAESEERSILFTLTVTKDLGDIVNEGEFHNYYSEYKYDPELVRHDPDLVQIVDELGDKANGSFSDLKIVDIPDDVEYEIGEYDGNEWVSEKHRTWR